MLLLCTETALAETSGTCGENMSWILSDNGELDIQGTGMMTDYYIINSNGDSYTDAPWGTNVRKVQIGKGVLSIGAHAFHGCSRLEVVDIQGSITHIGYAAFENCSNLQYINLPDGISVIKGYAFRFCSSLPCIFIPNSVTAIDMTAFSYCNASRYTTDLCSNASYVLSKAGYSFRVQGTKYDLKYLYSDNVISGLEIRNVDKELEYFSIPDGITSIGNYAFYNCSNLKKVRIPESVTNIDVFAFSSCNSLTDISIPKAVMSIGNYAFSSCNSLEKAFFAIDNSNSNIVISQSSFPNTAIYCHPQTAPDLFFSNLGYNVIYLENISNLNSIRSLVFPTTTLQMVCGDIAELEYYVFPANGESITWTTNDANILKVENGLVTALSSGNATVTAKLGTKSDNVDITVLERPSPTELDTIYLPQNLTKIENEAFAGIASQAVIIPDGCAFIGEHAFIGCPNLLYVKIPATVKFFPENAFERCNERLIIDWDKE